MRNSDQDVGVFEIFHDQGFLSPHFFRKIVEIGEILWSSAVLRAPLQQQTKLKLQRCKTCCSVSLLIAIFNKIETENRGGLF